MLVWIGFAILAAAVTWAVTRPLLAQANAKAPAPDSELAVYRDQLAEIETERADGLIAGSEAEAARIEVARRLIRTAEEHARLDAAPSAREASRESSREAPPAPPAWTPPAPASEGPPPQAPSTPSSDSQE